MAEFRLSIRAQEQLEDIYELSDSTFGEYQALAYFEGMTRTFGLLADFPGIGVAVDDLARGYRRFRFQSHYIFYTEEVDYVLIRALIHVKQNVRPALFE